MKQHEMQNATTTQSLKLNYELAELWEFERGTDEAAAVKSALGEPLSEKRRNIASLPLIIVGYDARRIIDLLVEQRGAPETCLRPIVVIGLDDARPIDPLITQASDLLLPPRPSLEALLETGRTLNLLNQRVREMPLKPGDGALTLLQLLYSRNQPLEPIIDAGASMAYDFPLATMLMDAPAEKALEILEDLAHYNMLDSKSIDRVFVCPDCHDYRLPVKELCGECHSANLSMEDYIHHFRCSYVAPESEFMQQGKPVCPKCHAALRHIGVEYNRPGHFSICHDCGHWASEPEIRAWCVPCNTYHVPGDLVPLHIKSFRLSENGIQVARSGSWDPNAIPELEAGAGDRPDPAAGDAGYKKALTRMLVSLAADNQHSMTVYRVDLAPEAVHDEAHLDQVERLLYEEVGNRDMVARIEAGALVMALPRADGQSPDEHRIQRYIMRKLDTRVDVTVLDQENAAEVLAQA